MARGRIAAELDPRTTDREQLMAASDVTVPDDAAGATARTDPDAPTLPEAPTTTTEDE
jgi:hypothetical protein